jgi:peptide chain release factor 2
LELYNSIGDVVDDIEVLQEFQKEGEASEEEVDERYKEAIAIIEEVEFKATLDKEEDELGAFLEINA